MLLTQRECVIADAPFEICPAHIVGLSGFAQVGKDTAAAHMPGYTRFAFADPLKADLAPIFALLDCDIADPAHKAKIRPLLVEWGRTARRFNPDFWIERTMRAIRQSKADKVVITDVRYPNEVAAIRAQGGQVIRIDRPNITAANEEERLSISEIDRRFPDLPRILNDTSPEALGSRVRGRVHPPKQ